jgi:hypothetical protein
VRLLSRRFLESLFQYLDKGPFWQDAKVLDPRKNVSRHGIAHGIFTGFECEEISLKYLALFEGLALALIEDRCVRGAL